MTISLNSKPSARHWEVRNHAVVVGGKICGNIGLKKMSVCIVKMPNQNYYQTHREELLPKMRELSQKRREELRELYRQNPEALELARARARERYKKNRIKKAEEQLKVLAEQIADESVKDAIITILETNSVSKVPNSVLNNLSSV